jgi:hypothetical protein
MLNVYQVIQFRTVCFAHGLINGKYPTVNFQLVYTCAMHSRENHRSEKYKKLYTHRTETTTGDRGIQSALERAWNSLPFELRNEDDKSFAEFKGLMKKYIMSENRLGLHEAALNRCIPIKCRQERCTYEYCYFCTH